METTTLIPIAVFVGTLLALLSLRYRDFASLTEEEKLRHAAERSDKAASTDGGRVLSLAETLDEFMPTVVSLSVLVASLYIILSASYGDAQNKWAYGSVGMILGYWLRSTIKGKSRGRVRLTAALGRRPVRP